MSTPIPINTPERPEMMGFSEFFESEEGQKEVGDIIDGTAFAVVLMEDEPDHLINLLVSISQVEQQLNIPIYTYAIASEGEAAVLYRAEKKPEHLRVLQRPVTGAELANVGIAALMNNHRLGALIDLNLGGPKYEMLGQGYILEMVKRLNSSGLIDRERAKILTYYQTAFPYNVLKLDDHRLAGGAFRMIRTVQEDDEIVSKYSGAQKGMVPYRLALVRMLKQAFPDLPNGDLEGIVGESISRFF